MYLHVFMELINICPTATITTTTTTNVSIVFDVVVIIIIIILSPLCRVFTILYLAETMFLWYEVLHLFCIYSLCYIYCYFVHEICFVLLH